MKDTSISTLSFYCGALVKRYLEMNGIKGAFVWKEGPRHYQVLEGNPDELTGFVCGEFRTKRAAKEKCDKINQKIRLILG